MVSPNGLSKQIIGGFAPFVERLGREPQGPAGHRARVSRPRQGHRPAGTSVMVAAGLRLAGNVVGRLGSCDSVYIRPAQCSIFKMTWPREEPASTLSAQMAKSGACPPPPLVV